MLVVYRVTKLRRYQKKETPHKGKDTTWEGAILKQALYDAQDISDKFAAVIFEQKDEPFLPQCCTIRVCGSMNRTDRESRNALPNSSTFNLCY